MRFSYQRDIIYKSICGVETHPTAADVLTMVKLHIKNISMGTIYRNLAQLVKKKLIRELNISGVSHYDGNMTPHQHFICNKCNSIIDYSTLNDWNEKMMIETNKFDIQAVDIMFSGLCQRCKLN